jgi:hypothetical protein
MQSTVALIFLILGTAMGEEFFDEQTSLDEGQARFLYFNSSSTATSLTLLGAVILLGVIAYLVYAGGLLGSNQGYNRNGYEQGYYQDQQDPYYHNSQYRSNDDASSNFDVLAVLRWIQVLQEMYSDFDYNDLECQKKIICEVMAEPEYYGSAAQKFKSGFRYARYLEAFSLPDELRELLDEYLDANARADTGKDCSESFQCPYSIKNSVKNNVAGNAL